MNQDQIKQIKKVIEITLADTTKIWEDKSESHAYLVGYLQGALKTIANELNK
jgi:hypothetical protein